MDHRIDRQDMISRVWKFSHESGHVAAQEMGFRANGTISGYDHPNERSWSVDEDTLSIRNAAGDVTVRLGKVGNGPRLLLKGAHIPSPDIILCLEEVGRSRGWDESLRSVFGREIRDHGWDIGAHTYGIPQVLEAPISRLSIGRYCSIAQDVVIALGDHRTDTLTTYPFRAFAARWDNVPADARDHASKGPVRIGSDVWIGCGAFI